MAKEFSSRDAKNLISRINSLQLSLRDRLLLETILKNKVKTAADIYIAQEVQSILQNISVNELSREKKGIKTKTLIDNGFKTIADVHKASVYN